MSWLTDDLTAAVILQVFVSLKLKNVDWECSFFFLVSHTVDVNRLEMNCFRAGYLIMFFFFWLQLKSDVFLVWCHGIHDRFESTPHCVIPGPITNVYTHLYHEPVRVCDVYFFVADLTSAVSSGLHVASLCVFSLGFSATTNTLNNRHSVIDSGDCRGSRVSCRLCGSSNSRGWIPHNILQPVWAAPCRPPLSLFLSHMALVFTLTVTKEQ